MYSRIWWRLYNRRMTRESAAAASITMRGSERFASGLRAVGLGLLSNLALIVLKGTIGVAGHSQGLVADAIHSGADLINSGSAFASLLVSLRPADLAHPYDHGRAEALAATFRGLCHRNRRARHRLGGGERSPRWPD
ncbi:MAG TPA: cation transporter [Dehalococcoidia bacterium]|nr:cation transporter [Dehalococcoidia bacterium]